MNVTRQEVNAETAILTVKVSPADYQGKVNASLEKYRKQAKVPGFRPGKVPMVKAVILPYIIAILGITQAEMREEILKKIGI
jgi:FKBP-type peptidyl-prolyl cis-trans isomerase (trigger factor)